MKSSQTIEAFLQERWLDLRSGRTGLLLAGLFALALGGWSYAVGLTGALFFTAAAVAVSITVHWLRSRLALKVIGARPLPGYAAPHLHRLVHALAARAGVPAPRLYLLRSDRPNAMVVGHGRLSAVAVTSGLVEQLPAEEVAAVIAHEVSHLRHADLPLAMLAGGLAGAAIWAGERSLWAIVAGLLAGLPVTLGHLALGLALGLSLPFVGLTLRMALSRERELNADAAAAELVGDPAVVAQALWRLDQLSRGSWWQRLLRPFTPEQQDGLLLQLLRSHPPTDLRIRRLMAMAPPRRPQLALYSC